MCQWGKGGCFHLQEGGEICETAQALGAPCSYWRGLGDVYWGVTHPSSRHTAQNCSQPFAPPLEPQTALLELLIFLCRASSSSHSFLHAPGGSESSRWAFSSWAPLLQSHSTSTSPTVVVGSDHGLQGIQARAGWASKTVMALWFWFGIGATYDKDPFNPSCFIVVLRFCDSLSDWKLDVRGVLPCRLKEQCLHMELALRFHPEEGFLSLSSWKNEDQNRNRKTCIWFIPQEIHQE